MRVRLRVRIRVRVRLRLRLRLGLHRVIGFGCKNLVVGPLLIGKQVVGPPL